MDNMKLHFDVDGEDFTRAGEASGETKRVLKGLGFDANVIRNVSIAMYEGEINMVIHAGGGEIDVEISPECISMVLTDHGPGIPDIKLAMQEGWSTAPDYIRQMGFGAGMGLPNMMKCSDKFDIQSKIGEGTSITMEFKHISEDL